MQPLLQRLQEASQKPDMKASLHLPQPAYAAHKVVQLRFQHTCGISYKTASVWAQIYRSIQTILTGVGESKQQLILAEAHLL